MFCLQDAVKPPVGLAMRSSKALSEHPLFPGKEKPWAVKGLQQPGHAKRAPKKPAEDLSPQDVIRSHRKIQQRLRHHALFPGRYSR